MSRRNVQVYEPGTAVILHGEVKAIVTAVQIRGPEDLLYEVAWLNNGQRQSAWVGIHEIKATDATSTMKAGFR